MLKRLFLVALFLIGTAHAQLLTTGAGGVAATYVGPIDAFGVAASAWSSCTRVGRASYGAGSACTLRRTSDSTTQTINYLANGAFDSATANTFAGTDATATCTSSGTAIACTGASSTPHQWSTITGAGLTQPCYAVSVGTFTAGAGTVTSNGCGTVSIGETLTLQYGLFVSEMFDVSGGAGCALAACNYTQATAGDQPQWLPNCLDGGTLPCIANTQGSAVVMTSGNNFTPATGTVTLSGVARRVGTSTVRILSENGTNNRLGGTASANSWTLTGGASGTIVATVADGTTHSFNDVVAGASSVVNVDGTETTGTVTGNTAAGVLDIFAGVSVVLYIGEVGFVDNVAATLSQRTNTCANQAAYYGTTAGSAC